MSVKDSKEVNLGIQERKKKYRKKRCPPQTQLNSVRAKFRNKRSEGERENCCWMDG